MDEGFHDDEGSDRKQYFMVFDIVQFEYDESFMEQIQFFTGIEKVIEFASGVKGFQHIEEVIDIEFFFSYVFCGQDGPVFFPQVFVEGIETGEYFFIFRYFFDVEIDGIGDGYFF